MCIQFAKGKCQDGEYCRFAHEMGDLRVQGRSGRIEGLIVITMIPKKERILQRMLYLSLI